MSNELTSSCEKTLGRITSLIKGFPNSQSFLDSVVPSFLLTELSSTKLPSNFEAQVQYLLTEREVLFKLIQIFRQENKVIKNHIIEIAHRKFYFA